MPAARPTSCCARRVAWTWKVKLSLSLERDLFGRLREEAEDVAIKVFGHNLRDLLLAAPAGRRAVMGLDPGIRTGVKVAVVSDTGKVLETTTVYPHEPRRDWDGALHTLARLVAAHGVNLIAIGNGTASRETDTLAADLMRRVAAAAPDLQLQKVVVSEAGASVYSASEFASKELPELDVSLRGAVSIARRLQDPLAELVKIDPKSIGVGQYQHDVNPGALARRLDAVVEDCVNAVGVDLNTASVPLLARVSGLTPAVAASIVRWRDAHGAFRSRAQLLDVAGLGPKTFEQAAGFLRIRDGDNPLDMTGVHPETYALVQKMISATGRPIERLMGASDVLKSLKPEAFADERFGAITVKDILAELEKPGRDPRPDFKVARFNEGVNDLQDLKPGMLLEGTVSNVAAVRRLRRPGRAPGRAGAREPAGQSLRQRRARDRQDRRHRQGARGRGGPGAQANRVDDEAGYQAGTEGGRQQLQTGRARRKGAAGSAADRLGHGRGLREAALRALRSPRCRNSIGRPCGVRSAAWSQASR